MRDFDNSAILFFDTIEGFLEQFPAVLNRARFKIYSRDNFTCVSCGLKGEHICLLMDDQGGIHFLVLAYDNQGEVICFSLDHRLPKSLGGKKDPENLDTMCEPCNQLKSDSLPEEGVMFS